VRVKSGTQLHAAAVLFYHFEFSGERDRYFVFISKSSLIETLEDRRCFCNLISGPLRGGLSFIRLRWLMRRYKANTAGWRGHSEEVTNRKYFAATVLSCP
jgi:hypothetical protein